VRRAGPTSRHVVTSRAVHARAPRRRAPALPSASGPAGAHSEVPSSLPNTARPFPTPRACQGRLERRAALRSPGLPCSPSAVACARVPEASSARPLVTWGSARCLKRSHGPWPRHTPVLPAAPSRPPAPLGSRGELQLPGRSRVPKASSTLLRPTHSSPARFSAPPSRPSPEQAAAAGTFLAAGVPALPATPHPQSSHEPNPSDPWPLFTPFPSQTLASLAGICSTRAGRPPQGPHCKKENLSEGLPAFGNSNSKSALAVSCKFRRKS
jgi:hypothetical protein